MASYNRINGEFGARNKYLLTDVLRKEWKYQGGVVSDWGAANDIVSCMKMVLHWKCQIRKVSTQMC